MYNKNELYHHGILGQKWGRRRYQNSDGTRTPEGKKRYSKYVTDAGATRKGMKVLAKNKYTTKNMSKKDKEKLGFTDYNTEGGYIKKDTQLFRIGAVNKDPTALNRKYFSTNSIDNAAWRKMLMLQNMEYGDGTYDLRYVAAKDLKIASASQAGKVFVDKIANDKSYSKILTSDINNAQKTYSVKLPRKDTLEGRYGSIGSTLIAAQTKTGKRFVDELLKSGYDGMADINGTDVSHDPVIIFNPDKNTKYVKTVREYHY